MRAPVILCLVGMISPAEAFFASRGRNIPAGPRTDQRITLFFFCGGRIINSSTTSTDPHKRRPKAESNQGHGGDKKKYVHYHLSWSSKSPLQWGEVLRRAPRRALRGCSPT